LTLLGPYNKVKTPTTASSKETERNPRERISRREREREESGF
jgi:hypothetical protein